MTIQKLNELMLKLGVVLIVLGGMVGSPLVGMAHNAGWLQTEKLLEGLGKSLLGVGGATLFLGLVAFYTTEFVVPRALKSSVPIETFRRFALALYAADMIAGSLAMSSGIGINSISFSVLFYAILGLGSACAGVAYHKGQQLASAPVRNS